MPPAPRLQKTRPAARLAAAVAMRYRRSRAGVPLKTPTMPAVTRTLRPSQRVGRIRGTRRQHRSRHRTTWATRGETLACRACCDSMRPAPREQKAARHSAHARRSSASCRRRAGVVPASCASSYASRNTSANNELKLESVRNASTTRAKPASRRAPPPPAPCACRRPSIAAPCARRQVAPASQHADGAAGVSRDSAPSMRAPGPACGVTASGRFDGARDAQGATDASPHTRRPASASMIRLTTDAPPTCASALPLHAASSPTGAIVFLSRVAKPCLAIAADAERSRGRVSKPRKARFASNDSRPEAVAIEDIARAGKRAAVPPIANEGVETAEPIGASR